jgi:hypothetical protein
MHESTIRQNQPKLRLTLEILFPQIEIHFYLTAIQKWHNVLKFRLPAPLPGIELPPKLLAGPRAVALPAGRDVLRILNSGIPPRFGLLVRAEGTPERFIFIPSIVPAPGDVPRTPDVLIVVLPDVLVLLLPIPITP